MLPPLTIAITCLTTPQLLHKGGADVPEWFEAGRVYLDRNPNVNFGEAPTLHTGGLRLADQQEGEP